MSEQTPEIERRRWHTVESLAEELGVTTRVVREMRYAGMPCVKPAGTKRILFDMRAVDAWLEGQA